MNRVTRRTLFALENAREHRVAGSFSMNGTRVSRRHKVAAPAASTSGQMTPQQANLLARQACVKMGVDMWQQIFATTINTGAGTVLNVPIRQVGLVKRLLVRATAQVQANGQTLTLAPFGPSQLFSNITLTDLSNQTRINTAGWHLFGVASAKRRQPYGAAFTTDSPCGYGNNFGSVMAAPAQITTNPGAVNLFVETEVPCSYTDMDLRGAIYMNVTNATAYLQLTVNPNFFVSNTADPTFAVYQSSSATLGLLPSINVIVYQNYLDQLPQAQNGGPVLPLLDLSTAYLLNTTPVGALVQNQDVPIPYANFRDFMSTFVIFDNNGVLNVGSDVNNWSIQSANFTNILKVDPFTLDFMARLLFKTDPPKGTYYLDHRNKPISTVQYGNMQLVLNASAVTAGAALTMGYESLALINMITQAGSLYGT